MKIYIITDTHFFHDKIAEYCDRPKNHTEIIGENLLSINLSKDDILIHLGDICVGNDQKAHELYIQPLVCRKWLVRGNHDNKSNSWYIAHGWDWVGDQFIAKLFGKKILFSHLPQKIDNTIDMNIHGHFHNTLHRLLNKKWVTPEEEKRNMIPLSVLTDKHKLLVLEDVEYKPIPVESLI